MRGISGLFWIVYDGDIQWRISWGDHRHVAVGAEYSILPRLDERQLLGIGVDAAGKFSVLAIVLSV
jgi:hypothetical protein